MCCLIGRFRFQENVQPLVLDPLCHRGPDAEEGWFSEDCRCWLGHTRLAIQDLSEAGAQPITSHCGRFTLAFNGEIYNDQQVRKGLRCQGWRGHGDSETLDEGLAQRGPALLLELRGMFAFAAYNRAKEKLLLARDRLGIKPMYLAWEAEGGFARHSYHVFSRTLSSASGASSSGGHNQLWIRDLPFVQERCRTAPPVRVNGMEL